MTKNNAILTYTARSGEKLAYISDPPGPGLDGKTGVFWLGGFVSDMTGSKAQTLSGWARQSGRACLRFDYSGHGASSGAFTDGTISSWLAEAVEMFQRHAPGPRIVIGSSMGGWLALLLLRSLMAHDPASARRIRALVLIAPAVDMTEDLMWARYGEDERKKITTDGFLAEPSEYGDDPYIITRKLIEDGRHHMLIEQGMDVDCPVHILQGEDDPDVPVAHAMRVYQALRGDNIMLTMIKHGDHRLSTRRDLATMSGVCEQLCMRADG